MILIGSFFHFYNCEGDKKDNGISQLAVLAVALSQSNAGNNDLPQPNLNTAILRIDNEEFTLTGLDTCETGGTGIIIAMLDADNRPKLNIHNIDFSKTENVSIGGLTGSHLDIDMPGGVLYGAPNNCPATVKETSPTVYDIQVLNCPVIDQNGGPSTPTVSFRARCTKQ